MQHKQRFTNVTLVTPHGEEHKDLLIDGDKIDGTTETDGIDVTSIKTSKFPNGFFIAQDDDNDGLNQNFKLVDWNKILK